MDDRSSYRTETPTAIWVIIVLILLLLAWPLTSLGQNFTVDWSRGTVDFLPEQPQQAQVEAHITLYSDQSGLITNMYISPFGPNLTRCVLPEALLDPGTNTVVVEQVCFDASGGTNVLNLMTNTIVGRGFVFTSANGTVQLETATNLAGPWIPVTAASPYYIRPLDALRFYRRPGNQTWDANCWVISR